MSGIEREDGRAGESEEIREICGSEKIAQLAQQLNELCRTATFELTYKVGKFVIENCFGGSIEAWRRQGVVRASYRTLAKHSELMLSPSALCRAVSIYALSERLGGSDQWKRIGSSHFQEVLSVPSEQQQRQLLRLAESGGWSVARLRAEVQRDKFAPVGSERVGPATSLRKVARQLGAEVRAIKREGGMRLEPCALSALRQGLELLREQVRQLSDTVESFESLAENPSNVSEDDHEPARAP